MDCVASFAVMPTTPDTASNTSLGAKASSFLPSPITSAEGEAMTWTREKHVAAILNDIDPRVARAEDALLNAGLIRQVGERRDDDTGKMRPVYQFIKTAKNKSKWIETLCALPSDVLDAFEESVARDVTTEKDSRKGEAMSENDKRLAVYMYFVSREAMREGVEILNNLGYRYTEHPEHIDEADPNTTFV